MTSERPPFTQIETARLLVRRMGEADLAAFLSYRNDPEVARYQSWQVTTEEQANDFFAYLQGAEPGRPGDSFQFAVALRGDNRLIGDVYMRPIDYDERQAEIGYTLGREWQGQGYASEAVAAVLGYAFKSIGLHRIIAVVDQRNLPSITLLERLGMRREGASLQSFFNKGAYCDEYQYAILASEWLARP